MRSRRRRTSLSAWTCCPQRSPGWPRASVDELVREAMERQAVPGVSAAGAVDGRIEWARGWGVRTAGRPDPVTPETMFQAGSISKPVAALGALRLVAEGRL